MPSARPQLVSLSLITLLLAGLFVGAFATPASAGQSETAGAPELIAVKFHADWCGSCKRMGTVFTDLENKNDGQPVLFVELDLTNQTTRRRASYLAGALGLSLVWRENASKTGFVVLVDGKTHRPVGKLTADQSVKQMSAAIADALVAGS